MGVSEVIIMDHHPSRKGNILIICTLFEPNRLEQSSLQIAYEHVVPLRRRPGQAAGAKKQLDVKRSPQRRSA